MRALQNAAEFAEFIEIMKRERVESYLEIGSRFGGALLLASQALPIGGRIVSVDLPSDEEGQRELERAVRELSAFHDATLILGDSTHWLTIAAVEKLAPFDCVFIDGDHRFPAVSSDWEMYGRMARKLVAFHDISWMPRPNKTPIEVPLVWQQIKGAYRYHEIRREERDCGIGVIWK